MQTCKTCPYFSAIDFRAVEVAPSGGRGECHHSPPNTIFESTPWPDVSAEEFCGQHPANIAEAQLFIVAMMNEATTP